MLTNLEHMQAQLGAQIFLLKGPNDRLVESLLAMDEVERSRFLAAVYPVLLPVQQRALTNAIGGGK